MRKHSTEKVPAVFEGEASSPMCVLTLIYNEEFDEKITGLIRRQMMVARYTKVRDVVGARAESLESQQSEISARNHMLVIVAERELIRGLADQLIALRAREGLSSSLVGRP